MSLSIEVHKPFEGKWVNIGEVLPGREAGPMRNFNFCGEQETIIFTCADDDSCSTIFTFKKDKNKIPKLPDIVEGHHLESMSAQVLEKGQSCIIESRKWTDQATKFLRLTHT